jgi:hypothetical protein
LSIDPVTTDANTGTSFNRYTYANNSPYKYIDPDGRFGVVGALIGAGIEAALQIGASGHITSTKSIFVAAGVGAVTGGLGSVIGKAAVSGTSQLGVRCLLRLLSAAVQVPSARLTGQRTVRQQVPEKLLSQRLPVLSGAALVRKLVSVRWQQWRDWPHAEELRAMLGQLLRPQCSKAVMRLSHPSLPARQRRSVQLILVHPTRKRK